jgi:hypothetical protein
MGRHCAADRSWPARLPRVCRIGATRFGSCVVARSKKFWLLLSSEVEDKLSIKAGDTVSVALGPS